MPIRLLRTTLHPAWYQGQSRGGPYFEGWYYKLVDSSETHRLAVIPGIFRGSDSGESHAFVQVLDGQSGQTTYHEYPADTFEAAKQGLDIRVGPNRFSLDSIELEIETQEQSLKGAVSLTDLVPWPSTLLSPGAMGPFAWIPFLQTYHGVVSFDHEIHGSLIIDGETVSFNNGRGYTEKDWGHSFPNAWIWMQTNHFDQVGTSLTLSIATIPLLGFSFRGFLVGLWHAGTLYRFTTYTGAQIDDLTVDDHVHAVISDNAFRLEITGRSTGGGVLRGPTGVDMSGRVPESLTGLVTIRLSRWKDRGSRPIFEGTGRNAGLEVVGDTSRLLESGSVDHG